MSLITELKHKYFLIIKNSNITEIPFEINTPKLIFTSRNIFFLYVGLWLCNSIILCVHSIVCIYHLIYLGAPSELLCRDLPSFFFNPAKYLLPSSYSFGSTFHNSFENFPNHKNHLEIFMILLKRVYYHNRTRKRVGEITFNQYSRLFYFILFYFLSLRVAPAAYGGSQASGRIRAVVAGLHHSHSNTGSEPYL